MKSEYNKWIAGLQMLDKKISKNHFNSKHNNEDAIAKFAKEYNLDKQALDLGPILFGTVGTWSKFYKVKNYEDRRSLTE
jgi:hypothetical protein